MIRGDTTTRKLLEKLHGCLNYVADIEPFGRPFLSQLTNAMSGASSMQEIVLSRQTKLGLKVWRRILTLNKGISFDYVLDRLPRTEYDIFVDASTSWGIGGYCGRSFFSLP